MRLAALLLALLAQVAFAACDDLYPNDARIAVMDTVELCNSFYVAVFSETRRGVVFTSERFRPRAVAIQRAKRFKPDPRLSPAARATSADYTGSGFDRGHLTPAADATSDAEMEETFLLSNVSPQDLALNRAAWKNLEDRVRDLVTDGTKIVTGVIYPPNPKVIGKTKIPVPRAFFKIVYVTPPRAWISDGTQVVETTIDAITRETGIAFPTQ